MGLAAELAQFVSRINNQSAELNDRITRLENAKREIKQEQSSALTDWNTSLTPGLETNWEGDRASTFSDSRKKAYDDMLQIFHNKYDEYIQMIDLKMNDLKWEKSALSIAKELTGEAERLLKKGEGAAEELGRKVKQIRRHLS